MSLSTQDRALLQSLREAEHRLHGATGTTPRSRTLRTVAAELLTEAREVLEQAVAREDRADTEETAARWARQEAFDGLRDAYARLYAGLHAGVHLAAMRGEPSPAVGELRVYLGDAPPSGLARAAMGHIRSTVEAAAAFLDAFIPDEDRAALRDLVTSSLAAADEAERAVGRASMALQEARGALYAARDQARTQYLAARDALSSGLRLEGSRDRLNVILPPFERVRRPGGARGAAGVNAASPSGHDGAA